MSYDDPPPKLRLSDLPAPESIIANRPIMSETDVAAPGEEKPKVRLSELQTPAFVINHRTLLNNCRRVRAEAAENGILKLRPHVKTHKTPQGAFVQAFGRLPSGGGSAAESGKSSERDGNAGEGVEVSAEGTAGAQAQTRRQAEAVGFVASTIPEIEMLLKASAEYSDQIPRGGINPFKDILYGIPISQPKLSRIDSLIKSMPRGGDGVTVHVLIDHPTQLRMCEEYVERSHLTSTLKSSSSSGLLHTDMTPYFTAFLKVDTGYHRAGVPPNKDGLDLATKLMTSKSVKLRGIYSHCGHAYDASGDEELSEIAKGDVGIMRKFLGDLVSHMEDIGWGEYARLRVPNLIVSVGSTPSLFHHTNNDTSSGGSSNDISDDNVGDGAGSGDDPKPLNLELHPGNYALFDRQQLHSGSCPSPSSIAGSVLATVIGHYPDRDTILLDAGALALSKDRTPQGGTCSIAGRDDLECYSSSQEVTDVRIKTNTGADAEGEKEKRKFPFEDFPLGSRVRLLPNHSCLSAACFDKYHIIDHDEEALACAGRELDEVEVVDEWIPSRGW